MLYKFVEGYTADYTAKNRCIALYTDTRCVTALHRYTATIQLNSAIQLYDTALYTIQPLQSPSGHLFARHSLTQYITLSLYEPGARGS